VRKQTALVSVALEQEELFLDSPVPEKKKKKAVVPIRPSLDGASRPPNADSPVPLRIDISHILLNILRNTLWFKNRLRSDCDNSLLVNIFAVFLRQRRNDLDPGIIDRSGPREPRNLPRVDPTAMGEG
jgi:hypothetical protein